MTICMDQLTSIIETSDVNFDLISGQLGIILGQSVEGGRRYLRAKLSRTIMTENGYPEIESVSVKYTKGCNEKWNISQPEKAYLLKQTRDRVFESSPDIMKSTTEMLRNCPKEGQYFGIEGFSNYMKMAAILEDNSLFIECGTGKNTYQRTYKGTFIVVQKDQHTDEVFLLGQKSTIEGILKDTPTKLRHIFSIHRNAKFNYAYR